MKSNFTPVFLICLLVLIGPAAFTQWSDTKNQFADSLHMPVCQAADVQQNSLLLRSYPDSGYFVIWQDSRNQATNRLDIYAQKYDKNGNALWALNGVPIASGANDQHYTYAANVNYRNYSIAATDSAGGFYFTYIDDSVNNYTWRRIMAQNILSDGSQLIPGGFVVAQTPSGQNYDFSTPQLIADDRGGFYVSYLKIILGGNELYAHNYKKQNATLVHNGGGWLNEYGRESQSLGPCGIINAVTKYSTTVNDYFIWPDGQGGCNVVMNIGLVGDVDVIGFNRLVRVKKDCKTVVYRRTTDIADCDPYYSDYTKDEVVVLHKYRMFSDVVTCGTPGPPPVFYTQTSFYIENGGLGFLILASGGHDYYYVKGATLSTPGNINADVIAFNQRNLVNFSVTPIVTRAISRAIEKYDSIPYELCSNDFCYTALRTSPEGKVLNRLDNINDTILSKGALDYYNFSIAASADKFFATARLWPGISSERTVYLQQLKLIQAGADSFSLHYNTPSKSGVVIGQDISTGFGSNSISYDDPVIATDNLGNGVFYIRDYYRHTRVSPIINGYELAWGAMGKPTGTGIASNLYPYRPEFPYVLMDPLNGTGLITWQDDRTPPTTFSNIYVRHLDSLNVAGHFPPNKPVAQLYSGGTFGSPAAFLGSSKQYSVIEAYNSTTGKFSPVVEVLDNYNLGVVEAVTYSHTGAIRMHNGKPYLNRNFTIKVQNNPAGAATINLRLYFTAAEFDALQAADPSITNPGLLAVVKQGNNTTAVPSTYTPVAGEEIVVPKSWSPVPGGYYIEIEVTSFSNFFVFKNENALPVTWVNVYAQWHNNSQAKVSWQIADEVNVEKYVVQHSIDGSSFTVVCTVNASNSTLYNCIVPGHSNATNYYRVKEVDKDGFASYSKVVLLTGNPADNLITLFPNPASKVLNIQTTIDTRQMTVIDAQGRNLYTWRGQNRTITIDVTRYAKGIYTLMITDNKGIRHYTKFMVE
jgi:hypothetical protein